MVAICSLPSGSKKSNATRRPSARQSEKKPGSAVSWRTCEPSGSARKSGPPSPVVEIHRPEGDRAVTSGKGAARGRRSCARGYQY